jgi:hypothetical protein
MLVTRSDRIFIISESNGMKKLILVKKYIFILFSLRLVQLRLPYIDLVTLSKERLG